MVQELRLGLDSQFARFESIAKNFDSLKLNSMHLQLAFASLVLALMFALMLGSQAALAKSSALELA